MAEKRFFTSRLSRLILFWALVIHLPFAAQIFLPPSAAGTKSRFQITANTLDHLRLEGLQKNLVTSLEPLLEKVFPTRDSFLEELAKLEVPPRAPVETGLILRYSAMDQLKIRAETFSADQKLQESVFRGNVKGELPRENIQFSTSKLRMLVGERNTYERLIGEGGIRITQWDREVRADYLNYTRGFDNSSEEEINPQPVTETIKLEGSVLLSSFQGKARSSTLVLDLKKHEAVLEGKSSSGTGRVRIEAYPDRLAKDAGTFRNTDSARPPSQEIVLHSSRANLDSTKRRILFEGNVEMERSPEDLYVGAGAIQLNFDKNQRLTFAQARQFVCIEQPGRMARADQARFDEIEQIILLEGNAEVDSGRYHLQGQVINLYLDVDRGVVQGDSESPIQMTMKMGGDFSPSFNCR